ncbi:hypothetical protein EYV94_16385 [Puteibacter caeruleilacunae]|nr:hypothetical protein EYV94_16385 [Puteibacter caeruleilacunae]
MKHASEIEFEFVPFRRMGVFTFGENIRSYYTAGFVFEECDDKTEWDTYKNEGKGFELYVENDLIASIACRKELYYKGENVIGMRIDGFLEYYGLVQSVETDKIFIPCDNDYQDVYEFDDVGLQVWVKDNVIETVFCSPMIID